VTTDSTPARELPRPTPYPDVNTVLRDFESRIETILGNQFLGMYVSGSLALGDFAAERSDIDFVVMTESDLSDDHFSSLQALHARFNAGDSLWATEVEAVYIPKGDMPRHDPARARHPHVQRGPTNVLEMDQLGSDWVLQRHILREHGIVVAGPALHPLIDPVPPDDMRRAVIDLMSHWWGSMRYDPAPFQRRGYQVYTVLTMCRILFTLEFGAVVSKPAAARWARNELGEQWPGLIERALAWTKELQRTIDGDVQYSRELIHVTLQRCRQWKRSGLT
jgi:Domain of unknown function (DUF4111)